MKRALFILFLSFLMICSLGCQAAQEPEVQATATPKPTPTKTVEPTPVPTPTPHVGSYTTGLDFDGEYKPVLAVIENSPAARPQTGLQTADVVYEVPVEGSITRFVCVFSDNVPEEIMPVRSGRVPFLYIKEEWDAVFMHYGGSGSSAGQHDLPYSYYGHELYSDDKYDVDGLGEKLPEIYHRVSGISAPHNVMGNPLEAQKLYDYEPEPHEWLFDSTVTYTGDDVSEISLPMCSGKENFVTYTYDAQNDVYLRFMGGNVFKSAETDAQVSVKNIIVQYCTYEVMAKIKMWDLVGSGAADFYIGGKLVHGSWERATVDDDTIYYDDQGEQIVLRPGNTWIHIHPQQS